MSTWTQEELDRGERVASLAFNGEWAAALAEATAGRVADIPSGTLRGTPLGWALGGGEEGMALARALAVQGHRASGGREARDSGPKGRLAGSASWPLSLAIGSGSAQSVALGIELGGLEGLEESRGLAGGEPWSTLLQDLNRGRSVPIEIIDLMQAAMPVRWADAWEEKARGGGDPEAAQAVAQIGAGVELVAAALLLVPSDLHEAALERCLEWGLGPLGDPPEAAIVAARLVRRVDSPEALRALKTLWGAPAWHAWIARGCEPSENELPSCATVGAMRARSWRSAELLASELDPQSARLVLARHDHELTRRQRLLRGAGDPTAPDAEAHGRTLMALAERAILDGKGWPSLGSNLAAAAFAHELARHEAGELGGAIAGVGAGCVSEPSAGASQEGPQGARRRI
jgi:hypothetical protein